MNKTIHIADTSYLIAVYRLKVLHLFLKDKQVYITHRVYDEIIEKPSNIIEKVREQSLKEKILRSVNEFKSIIKVKKLILHDLEYKKMSKILDETRNMIAKIEGKKIDQVKTDHTVVALAIQFAIEGNAVFVYSLDKAINKVLEEAIKKKRYKITIIDSFSF